MYGMYGRRFHVKQSLMENHTGSSSSSCPSSFAWKFLALTKSSIRCLSLTSVVFSFFPQPTKNYATMQLASFSPWKRTFLPNATPMSYG